jgi:hypothetical protein
MREAVQRASGGGWDKLAQADRTSVSSLGARTGMSSSSAPRGDFSEMERQFAAAAKAERIIERAANSGLAPRMQQVLVRMALPVDEGGVGSFAATVRLSQYEHCFSGAQAHAWAKRLRLDEECGGSKGDGGLFSPLVAKRLILPLHAGDAERLEAASDVCDRDDCLYAFHPALLPPDTANRVVSYTSTAFATVESHVFAYAKDAPEEITTDPADASAVSGDHGDTETSKSVPGSPSMAPASTPSHVVYIVRVTTDAVEWRVEKRYSAFYALREALEQRYPDRPLPEVPRKRRVQNLLLRDRFNPAMLEARQAGLNAFLQELLSVGSSTPAAAQSEADEEKAGVISETRDNPASSAPNESCWPPVDDIIAGFLDPQSFGSEYQDCQ